ncbi:MAG: acyl-CoA thioesterase [Bacteroidetes bacterium]|nr:MAG: acyl-CoA thioesterase [Bacteroidota bacterium]
MNCASSKAPGDRKAEVFSHRFRIPRSTIDAQGHVNNLAYLEWCLEAAEAHWKQNATPNMQANYVWYVLRHSIDYKASAFEGEELEINTWVTYSEGVKSERHYKISRIEDHQIIIEAKTIWCLLNANTRRPTKITEEIRTLFMC